jgi:ATP-dependent Lon protease
MNPIFYFDELDKVSDSARGQEIIGILTHLIDTTQNQTFHDKYFSEVPLDLSKCIFIFSYNDENLVNPILRDRLNRIKTTGYEVKEKICIGKKYMFDKIKEQFGFTKEAIDITDDALTYIITNMTHGEQGVRNMKRCLETVVAKLNVCRIIENTKDLNVLRKQPASEIKFPMTIERSHIPLFLGTVDNSLGLTYFM